MMTFTDWLRSNARIRAFHFLLVITCVCTVCIQRSSRSEDVQMLRNAPDSITGFFAWLPASCETMMYVRPFEGDFRPSTSVSVDNMGESFLQMPLDALSGLSIDRSWNHLSSKKVKAIVSGATGFSTVKMGPGATTVCRGCIIVTFDGDLGDAGKKYMKDITRNEGRTFIAENTAVVETSGRLIDDTAAKLFTSQPTETTLVFTNDLELMKQCVVRIHDSRSTYEWSLGHKYLDNEANFAAVRKAKIGDIGETRFLLKWQKSSRSTIDITWLVQEDGKVLLPGYSIDDIRETWKLPPPVGLPPVVVKSGKDAVWLRLEPKTKEASESALYVVRAHLGFVGIP